MVKIGTGLEICSSFRKYLDILAGRTFSVLKVGTLYLISGRRSSPEKIIGKRFQIFMQHKILLISLPVFVHGMDFVSQKLIISGSAVKELIVAVASFR